MANRLAPVLPTMVSIARVHLLKGGVSRTKKFLFNKRPNVYTGRKNLKSSWNWTFLRHLIQFLGPFLLKFYTIWALAGIGATFCVCCYLPQPLGFWWMENRRSNLSSTGTLTRGSSFSYAIYLGYGCLEFTNYPSFCVRSSPTSHSPASAASGFFLCQWCCHVPPTCSKWPITH